MTRVWRLAAFAAFLGTPVIAADFSVPLDLGPKATIQLTLVKSAKGQEGRDQYTERPQTMQFREEVTAAKDGYHVVQTEGDRGGRVIAFDTDRRLAPIRITNWRDVVAGIRGVQAKRLRSMSPEEAGQSQLLQETAMAQAQLVDLDFGKPRTLAQKAYTPYGGNPISQTVRLELNSLDKAAGKAVIDYSAEFDRKELLLLSMQNFQSAYGRIPRPPELQALPQEESVSCRFTVDLKTGLAVSADCLHRSSFVSGDFREESWRLSQQLQSP